MLKGRKSPAESAKKHRSQDLEELIQLTDIPPEAKDDDYDPDKEAA